MELTKIELTNDECVLFREYMEHRENFRLLKDNGVFNIRNGQAICNFDSIGNLTQIDINVLMYKKGFPQVVIFSKL